MGEAPTDPGYDDVEKRLDSSPKISVPTMLLVGEIDGATLVESSAERTIFSAADTSVMCCTESDILSHVNDPKPSLRPY